jgi:hypothetical protein
MTGNIAQPLQSELNQQISSQVGQTSVIEGMQAQPLQSALSQVGQTSVIEGIQAQSLQSALSPIQAQALQVQQPSSQLSQLTGLADKENQSLQSKLNQGDYQVPSLPGSTAGINTGMDAIQGKVEAAATQQLSSELGRLTGLDEKERQSLLSKLSQGDYQNLSLPGSTADIKKLGMDAMQGEAAARLEAAVLQDPRLRDFKTSYERAMQIVPPAGREIGKAIFKGRGAVARMRKWTLPGDEYFLQDFDYVTNVRACLFFPAFILMIMVDGLGYMHETPTIWANGTIYNGTEKAIRGETGLDESTESMDRTRRTDLYVNGNLTCQYGEPVKYFGSDHGFFCPMVAYFSGPIATPLLWFVPFVILYIYAFCRGMQMKKRQSHSQKKKDDDSDEPRRRGTLSDIREQGNPKSCCTYPVGLYLGFYQNGFKDAHVHLWLLAIILVFVHSILARVFTENSGKCLRFGKWDRDSVYWDECLPMAAAEPGQVLTQVLLLVYCTWIGGLWTVPKPVYKDKPERRRKVHDPVTSAAIQMKALVHVQMRDSFAKAAQNPVTLWKALAGVAQMVGATSEVQDAVGDLAEMCEEAGEALGSLQQDFMEDFSEQLEQITSMADIDTGKVFDSMKTQINDITNIDTGKAFESVNAQIDDVTNLADVEADRLRQSASGSPWAQRVNKQEDLDDKAGNTSLSSAVGSALNQQMNAEVDYLKDRASMEAQALQSEMKQRIESQVDQTTHRIERQVESMQSELKPQVISQVDQIVDISDKTGKAMKSEFDQTSSLTTSLIQKMENMTLDLKLKKQPYFSVGAGALLGIALGVLFSFLFMIAPQGATFLHKVDGGFGQELCAEDAKAWCNGQSISEHTLAGTVIYRQELRNTAGDIKAATVILLTLKLSSQLILGALFIIMLQQTVEPFQQAAKPLEILGSILFKWVVQRHVTRNQLNAWILARRSFLYNECQLMLRENEKVVLFYILLLGSLLLLQVLMVFQREEVSIALVLAIGLCGLGAIVCVQAAIACYYEQQKHQSLLRQLKVAVSLSPVPLEYTQLFGSIIDMLKQQDYQTKLMFLPLNPSILKGIVAYAVTGIVAICGKLFVSSS